jgi:hypothetical protein
MQIGGEGGDRAVAMSQISAEPVCKFTAAFGPQSCQHRLVVCARHQRVTEGEFKDPSDFLMPSMIEARG